jgi:hypothetical protein
VGELKYVVRDMPASNEMKADPNLLIT